MPTVLLLDVSLSMCRGVTMPETTELFQLKNLAVHGINTLLDHMNASCKLEFCNLIVFSSLWEPVVSFTRDYESIKAALLKLECYDKTCPLPALEGVKNIVLEEWGAGMPCQVIMITDGSIGVGPTSLKHILNTAAEGSLGLPYPFQSKIHVMVLGNASDPVIGQNLPVFQKLIDLNGGGGQIFLPEGLLNLKTTQQMFLKLSETCYKSFRAVLRCGKLMSHVSLSPPPDSHVQVRDFETLRVELINDISICGFLDINDVSSPPSLSRHLVLPILPPKEELKSAVVKQEVETNEENGGPIEEGKQPSFCVLLHGSLKVEGMIALCQLTTEWYGMLYSWADSKKKSNLMLSTFEPGFDTIPWLGKFHHLGPNSLLSKFGLPNDASYTFPIKVSEKHSYSQNCVVWIRQSGLQADIQKILRHARKLPEKTQHFYKELNRLRRAALSFGFLDLLTGMATILDRECTLLPGTIHPDAALQLTHAASALRNPSAKEYNTAILPLRTKFSNDD